MPEFPSTLGYTCQNDWYFLSISGLVGTWEWVSIHSVIIRTLLYKKTWIKIYKCFDRGFDQNQFRLMTEQFICDQILVTGTGVWSGMQWCINLPGAVVFKFLPNYLKLVRKASLKQQQESFSFSSSESCAGITLSSTIRMKLGRLFFFFFRHRQKHFLSVISPTSPFMWHIWVTVSCPEADGCWCLCNIAIQQPCTREPRKENTEEEKEIT